MTLPQSKIGDFADLYFSLFNPKTKGMYTSLHESIFVKCDSSYLDPVCLQTEWTPKIGVASIVVS